jgi:hypothetical protein
MGHCGACAHDPVKYVTSRRPPSSPRRSHIRRSVSARGTTGANTTIADAAADLASGRITAVSLLAGARDRPSRPSVAFRCRILDARSGILHGAAVHLLAWLDSSSISTQAVTNVRRTDPYSPAPLYPYPDCTRRLESARPLNAYITETADDAAAAAAASDQRRTNGQVRDHLGRPGVSHWLSIR